MSENDELSLKSTIEQAILMVENARSLPLSQSVVISRDELLALLNEVLEKLPDELKDARWILSERDELIQNAKNEAEAIIEQARSQVERMVQRSEIIRQAKMEANKIISEAEERARKIKHEAVDYCDKKLAAFEIALRDIEKVVTLAREKLVPKPQSDEQEQIANPPKIAHRFFDQDQEDEN